MDDARFITRVQLEGYRSFARCDVALEPLTFLVGRNGAGKSNFVDALRLLSDGLRTSLEVALRDRGGVELLRHHGRRRAASFAIRADFTLHGADGSYAIEIGERARGDIVVLREQCVVGDARFEVREGEIVVAPAMISPPAKSDRLYLVNAAGLPPFAPVLDALSSMTFYSLSPDAMRPPRPREAGSLLARDGHNIGSVIHQLEAHPDTRDRIQQYLAAIAPGIVAVRSRQLAQHALVEFEQSINGAAAVTFPSSSMSDGTLRALAILVGLFQAPGTDMAPLIAIEEPELALHPAAAGALRDALREASRRVQVIVTSHSPDLLDDDEVSASSLLAVVADHDGSHIGSIDEAARSAMRDGLYTAGELLRIDQLGIDPETMPRSLFDEAPAP